MAVQRGWLDWPTSISTGKELAGISVLVPNSPTLYCDVPLFAFRQHNLFGQEVYSLRRRTPARPRMPVPNRMMLLGSGVSEKLFCTASMLAEERWPP